MRNPLKPNATSQPISQQTSQPTIQPTSQLTSQPTNQPTTQQRNQRKKDMQKESNTMHIDNEKRSAFFHWGEVLIVPAIALAMSVGLFFLHPMAGLAGLVATIFLGVHSYVRERDTRRRTTDAIESLDMRFDEVTKNAVFGMPFPMAVLNGQRNFLWYNSIFKKIFGIHESLLGKSYERLFPDISRERLTAEQQEPFRIDMDGRVYLFYTNVTETKDDTLVLLYGIDNTDDEDINRRYREEHPVLATVLVDNYDELRANVKESERPMVFAQIDRLLSRFAGEYNAGLVKYESDRYQMMLNHASLTAMQSDRFPLLEDIKSLESLALVTPVKPTVSIGVGYGAENPGQMVQEARQALDIALARGGDQVVLKSGEQLDYFGGKNQATQRFTKVKARVMSNTVRSFIEESTNVLIMGHQNPDMDALGSGLGMLQFVEATGVPGKIVLDSIPASIESLYEKVMEELPGAKEKLIMADQAMDHLKPGTLIIVLDNHRKGATAQPLLLDGEHRIIIIDHHRRGAGYIEGAEIAYIEPYSSSTSEMVAELISYQTPEIMVPKVVAEGLLAGITVDTKNFFYQTSTRTFEAAAFLKRKGADSAVVKELFKDDLERMRQRSEILAAAQEFQPGIMVSRFTQDLANSPLIVSQAADDLLGIRNVKASFVMTPFKGRIHISARSLGDISVQLIMEKIGGGGHLTAAATQLDGTLDEAEEKLTSAIREYLKEESNESNPA